MTWSLTAELEHLESLVVRGVSSEITEFPATGSEQLSNIRNKFEMFQTIISFINLIPPVFELAYAQYIKQKSR